MFIYINKSNTTAIWMPYHSRSIAQRETLRYGVVLFLSLALLGRRDTASAVGRIKPSRGDYAMCELSMEDKEKFLDRHNKFRGMVDPPAADMEYLVGKKISPYREKGPLRWLPTV